MNNSSFYYPRPILAIGYCRCLHLCVCVPVCVSVCAKWLATIGKWITEIIVTPLISVHSYIQPTLSQIISSCSAQLVCPNCPTVAYAKYRHGYGPILVRVIVCCLAATSHYLNQLWLTIIGVLWHSPQTVMLNTIYLSIGIVCQPLLPLCPHTVISVSCNISVIAQ